MLRVTWEWLGAEAALDLANTIAVSGGIEHDLLASEGEFERWAAAAAASPALDSDDAGAVATERERVLALRAPIRQILAATAAGEAPPQAAVAAVNRVSRASPTWLELDTDGRVRDRADGNPGDRVLAGYARSAAKIASEGAARLRICPAPSCGMFFRPGRRDQHWCSSQCGTRARVARHYKPTARRRRTESG